MAFQAEISILSVKTIIISLVRKSRNLKAQTFTEFRENGDKKVFKKIVWDREKVRERERYAG